MALKKPDNFSDLIVSVAKTFEGTPYVAHTLEGNPTEKLTVRLDAFDCLTFVETTWALAVARWYGYDYEQFKATVQKIRYRNGKCIAYHDRIHYLSEWLNQQHSFGRLKFRDTGTSVYARRIDFMSNNRRLYPALENEDSFIAIQNIEKELSQRSMRHFPKDVVSKIEKNIQSGDLIAITIKTPGLDYGHEGFAIKKNGKTYLLHASSDKKKVMVSEVPLTEYLAKNKSQTGIRVAQLSPNGFVK